MVKTPQPFIIIELYLLFKLNCGIAERKLGMCSALTGRLGDPLLDCYLGLPVSPVFIFV